MPVARLSMSDPVSVQAYLDARSIKNPITGCQVWQRSTSSQGKYGSLWIDGTIKYAHRVAYELANGELPAGSLGHETDSYEIHHTCADKRCIAPEHLELVTRRQHADVHQPLRSAIRLAKAA